MLKKTMVNFVVSKGWEDEGIGWPALDVPNPWHLQIGDIRSAKEKISILSALAITDVFLVLATAIVASGLAMLFLADVVSNFLAKNDSFSF